MPAGVTAITALANLTLGSTQATVTFSSISGSYRDLLLVKTGSSGASLGDKLQLNGDSGSNYSPTRMSANGSSTSGNTFDVNSAFFYLQYSFTNGGQQIIHLPDYATTDKHKIIMVRNSVNGSGLEYGIGRWASTSAITSITLFNGGTQFAAGSTFALYGISA